MDENTPQISKTAKMPYSERLARYEQDKTRIAAMKKTPTEYEALCRALAKKWRI